MGERGEGECEPGRPDERDKAGERDPERPKEGTGLADENDLGGASESGLWREGQDPGRLGESEPGIPIDGAPDEGDGSGDEPEGKLAGVCRGDLESLSGAIIGRVGEELGTAAVIPRPNSDVGDGIVIATGFPSSAHNFTPTESLISMESVPLEVRNGRCKRNTGREMMGAYQKTMMQMAVMHWTPCDPSQPNR